MRTVAGRSHYAGHVPATRSLPQPAYAAIFAPLRHSACCGPLPAGRSLHPAAAGVKRKAQPVTGRLSVASRTGFSHLLGTTAEASQEATLKRAVSISHGFTHPRSSGVQREARQGGLNGTTFSSLATGVSGKRKASRHTFDKRCSASTVTRRREVGWTLLSASPLTALNKYESNPYFMGRT
jgi:hypothetical protein